MQDAAEVLLHGRAGDDVEAWTTHRTVSELLATLRTFAKVYRAGEIFQLDGPFDVALFNTYRSFTFPDQASGSLVSHRDHRGQLSEAVRCRRGSCQTSFSITAPGVTRGQHFHLSKIERFVVMSGERASRCVGC